MVKTEAEVVEVVRDLLVQTLAVEAGTVVPEARIMDDLGAESIDLLDLRFRLEQAFAIPITSEDLATAFQGVEDRAQFQARFTVGALCRYVASRLDADGG